MTACTRLAVLVTGSRGWTDTESIRERLRTYQTVTGGKFVPYGSVLIHGGASGADVIADDAARFQGGGWLIERTSYFDWLDKRGGHVRNAMMLDKLKVYQKYGYICSVEAFSLGTPGTEGMIKIATKAGFAVHVTTGPDPGAPSTRQR
jgi:hypothetical protein